MHLNERIARHRKRVDRDLEDRRLAKRRRDEEREALADAKRKMKDTTAALQIARDVAQSVQEEAHRRVADIVTRSLAVVFDDPYQFRIKFEQKRGRTEARLVFIRDGAEFDPLEASGGGVVDVAAFALRLSCLLLSRPPVRRLLVLDEPFKHLSAEHRPRVVALLETLSKELGVQIIMVTHSRELVTGKVVYL